MERLLDRMRAKRDDMAKRIRPLGIRRRGHGDQAGTTLSMPDRNQEPLQYDALTRDRTIRVLDLAPGTWDEPVSCSLRTVHLDHDDLRYEAISYAWGDPNGRKTVICNGSFVSTTRSLFEALQRFRYVDSRRTLWADAICINQADNDERTSQVRLMSLIYTRAIRVLVWLQHDDDQVVQDSLNAICRFVCKEDGFGRYGTLDTKPQPLYRWRDIEVTSVSGDDSPGVTYVDALQQICSSPWFGRGWVIQEVALSISASVFWGHAEIDFEWLGIANYCIGSDQSHNLSPEMICCTFLFFRQRRSGLPRDQQDSFFDLIHFTSRFTFNEPKDRIYGLLGLKTLPCDPADGQSFIDPDYNITTLECYRRVAVKLLLEWHDLRVLSWASYRSGLAEDWLSWVPDWNGGPPTMLAGLTDELLKEKVKVKASLVDISETVVGRNKCIEISGFRVDTMNRDVKEYVNLGNVKDDRDVHTQLQAFLRPLEHLYGQQYLACTFGNMSKYLPLDSVRIANLLSNYRTFMERDFVQDIYSDTAASSPKSTDDDSSSSYEPNADRFCRRCFVERSGRTVFITSTEMLGLGPDAMLPGDVVVVLHGATVPFVLRPADDGLWRLVGECYLYEVNEGRIHKEWEEKGSVSEKFCIY